MNEIIYEDLVVAAGRCFSGDITPIVFHILKDTEHKKDLLTYLGYTPDEETQEKVTPSFTSLFGAAPIVGGY